MSKGRMGRKRLLCTRLRARCQTQKLQESKGCFTRRFASQHPPHARHPWNPSFQAVPSPSCLPPPSLIAHWRYLHGFTGNSSDSLIFPAPPAPQQLHELRVKYLEEKTANEEQDRLVKEAKMLEEKARKEAKMQAEAERKR